MLVNHEYMRVTKLLTKERNNNKSDNKPLCAVEFSANYSVVGLPRPFEPKI